MNLSFGTDHELDEDIAAWEAALETYLEPGPVSHVRAILSVLYAERRARLEAQLSALPAPPPPAFVVKTTPYR